MASPCVLPDTALFTHSFVLFFHALQIAPVEADILSKPYFSCLHYGLDQSKDDSWYIFFRLFLQSEVFRVAYGKAVAILHVYP